MRGWSICRGCCGIHADGAECPACAGATAAAAPLPARPEPNLFDPPAPRHARLYALGVSVSLAATLLVWLAASSS